MRSTLYDTLINFARQVRRVEQKLSAQVKLPLSQIRLILQLSEKPVNLETLSDQLALDTSTLSRQLGNLADKHLVQTIVPQDKRQRRYCLTSAGVAIHEQLTKQLTNMITKIVANWDPSEIPLLTTLLQRFLRSSNKLKFD